MTNFILKDRNKDNIDTMICMIYGFGVIFTGLMFNAKSSPVSLATLIYSYANFTSFPYQVLMPLFLRIVLWQFVSSKMNGTRCCKISMFLSTLTLIYAYFFTSNPFLFCNIIFISSIYIVLVAFYNEVWSKPSTIHVPSFFEKNFYAEDILFISLLCAAFSEIFFVYPWDKRILIRTTSAFFILLIFIFVLTVQIPHNKIWWKEHKDNSLFAPRNCLMNCFFLFLIESIWAGWEMSYGSALEAVTLSQISIFTLLLLVMLRKEGEENEL